MTAVWPPSLQQGLSIGSQETYLDKYIETNFDIGTPKRRLRFTGAMGEVTGTLHLLSAADMATWQTFFRTTLNQGTLPFSWHTPSFEAVNYLIMSKPTLVSISPTAWRISFKLRVVP